MLVRWPDREASNGTILRVKGCRLSFIRFHFGASGPATFWESQTLKRRYFIEPVHGIMSSHPLNPILRNVKSVNPKSGAPIAPESSGRAKRPSPADPAHVAPNFTSYKYPRQSETGCEYNIYGSPKT